MNDARTLLLAEGIGETRLPDDPALAEIVARSDGRFLDIVAQFPASPLVWALLAEGSLTAQTPQGDITAYAFARTGYHRGLDALRRAGWRGRGPIPWEHEPNQGFLRALWALAVAAGRIGETSEHDRCLQFLTEASPDAHAHLSSREAEPAASPTTSVTGAATGPAAPAASTRRPARRYGPKPPRRASRLRRIDPARPPRGRVW